MASTDARPVPQKNVAYRVTFPIWDADGDLVTGATGLDSEISKDGGTFTDCGSEATEIATASGMYYLDLTNTEMNADTVAIIVKTTSSGAKTTPIVLYPEEAGDIRTNVTTVNGTAINNLVSGRVDASVGAMAADVITASAIATDALTNAELATSAVTEIVDGVWNATRTSYVAANSFGQSLQMLHSGTAGAGAISTITFGLGASAIDNFYNDAFVFIINGTGVGQARMINSYAGATKVATVTPSWNVTPDNASVYVVLPFSRVDLAQWLGTTPNALQSNRVDAYVGAYASGQAPLQPTTVGRTLDVSTGGEAGIDWANIGAPTTTQVLSGTTVKTATDVETDTQDIQGRLPAALTGAGNIKADALAWQGAATATDDIALKATLAKGTDITGFNDLSAAQVNSEVDAALDTAIPGSPTADSINERVKSLDDNFTPTVAGRIDVAVSTRLASASYTAPDNATITAINAKTTNLPSDPADASDIAASFTTVNGKLDVIDDFLDTEVAAIKAKTDGLPSDPADASDIAASFTTVNGKLDVIDDFLDTEVAAIKAKTDNLPSDPADASVIATSFVNLTNQVIAVETKVDIVDNYVDTEVAAVKAVTDKLDTALELDGAVYRYTTNALEQAPAAAGGLTAAIIADAVWDEVLSGHLTAGTTGDALNGAGGGGTPPTVAEIAEAVWDEDVITLHNGVNAAGATLQAAATGASELAANILEADVTSFVPYSAPTKVGAILLRDRQLMDTLTPIGEPIDVDTGATTTSLTFSAYLLDGALSSANYVGAILLGLDGLNYGTARKITTYTPATGNVTFAIPWPVAPTAGERFELYVPPSGDFRPSEIRQEMDTNSTDLNTIIAQTDTLETSFTTVNGKLDTIDDFLDTEIAAIKAKTDALPADPASNTVVNTRLAASSYTAPDNAGISAINAKTTNLPTDPADASDIATQFATVNTKLNTIDDFVDTEVAAIKIVTDKVDTTLQLDGAVYRFTANALEQAPTGGGGGANPWDDNTADHIAVGTFGKELQDKFDAAGYTAPDNASIAAIKAKTDALPADPASNTQVNTRLAASSYLAPNNAGIADINATTDRLDTMIENVSGERFSAHALMQGPAGGGGGGGATPQEIWEYATRTLSAEGVQEIIDAILNIMEDEADVPGSVLALIVQKLRLIGGVNTVAVTPTMSGGVITLVQGDDYLGSLRVVPEWDYTDDTITGAFPVGTVFKWETPKADGTELEHPLAAPSVNGDQSLHFTLEIEADNTGALAVGERHWAIFAYVPGDPVEDIDRKRILHGPLIVLEPIS